MAAIFGENLRTAFLKGVEALGKGAADLAQGAHKKLDEIKLEGRRRDVLNEIPKCVNELYAQGVELPQQLTDLLAELADLDEQLAAMRPAPAPQEPEEPAEEAEAAEAEEEMAEEEPAVEEPAAEEAAEETQPSEEME